MAEPADGVAVFAHEMRRARLTVTLEVYAASLDLTERELAAIRELVDPTPVELAEPDPAALMEAA